MSHKWQLSCASLFLKLFKMLSFTGDMAVLLFCPCNTVHHLLFHYTVSIRGITIKAFNCFVGLHVGFVLSFPAN